VSWPASVTNFFSQAFSFSYQLPTPNVTMPHQTNLTHPAISA